MRGDDGKVSELGLLLAQETLEHIAHHGTAGQPQGQTQTYAGREGEQLHFLAELAVVALLGFLEHLQVLVEHALLGEGHAVDTGELLAALVALPVGTGYAGELHRLDVVDMLHMGAAAEIGERAVRVEGYRAVLEVVYELALVVVALLGEILHGVGLGHLPAFEGLLAAGKLYHLVLHGLEVGLGNLPSSQVDIIVETRLHGRAYAELYSWIQRLQCLGHKVGRRVPEYLFRLGIVPGTDAAVCKCNRQHSVIHLSPQR